MAGRFTLGKNERLKSRKETERLFREGNRFSLPPFRIFFHLVKEGETGILFGAGVSARQFKRAVDRNRIKRLLRECYRLQKPTLQQALAGTGTGLQVFFIYTGKELPAYGELYAKTGKVISRLIQQVTAPS